MGSVAKKKSTEVEIFDYGQYDGAGFENQTSDDYKIPFLGLLQAMSPQCGDPEDGGIEGARAGMLFNSVTNDLYSGKEGVVFVPAYTEHLFLEWVPRDQGGGIVGRHLPNSEIVLKAKSISDFGQYKTPNGNDLIETFQIYGVLADENNDPIGMVVIAFTSTKIKVYKNLVTKLRMFTLRMPDGRKVSPPLFAHRVKISSVKERNPRGEFHNFKISPAVDNDVKASLIAPSTELFKAAEDCKNMIEKGLAQADYTSQSQDAPSSRDIIDDEKVPF